MSRYTVHPLETAPEASRPVLEHAKKAYGRVPNIMGVMAESPFLLNAYASANKLAQEHCTLTPAERFLVFLTASDLNGCHYCTAAHTAGAGRMGLEPSVISALQEGREVDDPKLEALRSLTREMVLNRGQVSEETVEHFLDQGYTPAQVFDVVALVAMKTMTNYMNHLAQTPLEEHFKKFEWPRSMA